ncbi:hypothetical protein [Streptomyces sp. 142MFCol3.1]|uniref:hypothetical protein n=1 Tax=Streptomyces sp. 142MFCol3.1 TaxID=1172179 RepID=UPI00040B6D05
MHGIGRRRLLDLFAERARTLAVRVEFEREVPAGPLPDADLVVAGDGGNGVLRDRGAQHLGPDPAHGRNRYIRLGTTEVFGSFTFAFAETGSTARRGD